MRAKSIFIVGIMLLVGFGLLMSVSMYSNIRLQHYFETHTQANHLLLSWNRNEVLTKELFMTYDLLEVRRKWQSTFTQFNRDFQSFLRSPMIMDIIADDTGFAVEVAMIEMYWQVIHNLLQRADHEMQSFTSDKLQYLHSGNLLVDFGENWATGNYTNQLIDTISALRACVSLSQVSFSNALNQLSRHAAQKIQLQSKRMNISAMMLSALLLLTVGTFILFRLRTLTRSREASRRYADGLRAEVEERKRTAALLKAERDKLQGVLNAMGDGMYIVDREFNISYQNDIMARDFGSALDTTCYRKYGGFDMRCGFCLAHESIRKGKLQIAEAVLDDGKSWEVTYSPYVDVDGTPRAIVLWSDVTEKKKIEAEAVRAGHLASLGELSAGVAHEINNPINGIINYAERLEPLCRTCDIAKDIPSRIIQEGERIAAIVRNLLSFARNREKVYRPVPLQTILQDVFNLVERQLVKDDIGFAVHLEQGLPYINARHQELQQVFLNLISNARYALNFKGKHTRNLQKMLRIRAEGFTDNGTRFVRVRIHDNGSGIPKGLFKKICLPFFSTKPKGEGTGLGLSISHGIVSGHGGKMNFESVEGSHTTVIVDLPVYETS